MSKTPASKVQSLNDHLQGALASVLGARYSAEFVKLLTHQ